MKKIALIVPVMAALAATPAYAQGMGISPRIEAKVGYDVLDAEVRLDDSAFIESTKEGGVGFGFEAGVDANVTERILVGAYAGVDFPRISDCSGLDFFEGDEACIRNKRNWTLGVRAGVDVGDGGLIYVKGGVSKTKIRASYFDGEDELFDDSDSTSGLHVGAGFEIAVSGGVYVKAEYVHTRYKDVLEDSLGDTDSIDPSRNQIMGGVGFRFGGKSQ